MAQRSIREYHAKKLFANYAGIYYDGILIDSPDKLSTLSGSDFFVIKPDQLFGKRGKYGLVGVKLTSTELKTWFAQYYHTSIEIKGVTGLLDTFLIEKFVSHTTEYYLSCTTHRDTDIIHFSPMGGIDIEDHRDDVMSLSIGVNDNLSCEDIITTFAITDEKIVEFILQFFGFFREYGCICLETNPFVIQEDGTITCLDMVAKVDDCEGFKQRHHRSGLSFPKSFGSPSYSIEDDIRALDNKTGASLKLSILNANGSIWLILGGGGSSVITMDTLVNLGYGDQIGNYGELSGNPNTDDNIAYSKLLIQQMLASKSTKPKTLCIVGGIANFTDISSLFVGIKQALLLYKDEIIQQQIKILVRRGGINDTKALQDFSNFCSIHDFTVEVYDSDTFLTSPLHTFDFNK